MTADYKKWLGKASMFLAGFIMLTPHRIALSCAPHVAKRFHLPPATVGLFIYKMHNPMELASLSSTFLSNVVSWINDSTIKTNYLKRYCSIIFMWLMALCSVMTYFLFISGDDFGYLQYFYWNMVFFTFINGFASSFGFTVNFNTSMYGAGLPTSGGVTFLLHNGYKWLYKKYHWAEYDYNLMIMQMTTTIGLLFFTSILWTVDQCWNILEPFYAGWAIQGILDAANNQIQAPAGKSYTWNDKDGNSRTTGTSITVDTEQDKGNKRAAKYVKIAEELTSGTNSVKTRLETVWGSVSGRNWKNLWTQEPFKDPVIILSVVGGVLGLLFIMGVIIIFKIDESKPFIITGILFSILASTSTFSALIPANTCDKMKLKDIDITVADANYEYYNFKELWRITSTDNNKVGDATTDPGDKSGGTKKIAANRVSANDHFQTNGNEPKHAPKIRVTTGITTNAEDLAKANIIAVIGIVSIVVIFASVLLFSIIIFCRDKNSLAAPLFLFTFITSVSALTFGGIAISSAIAGIYMHNQLAHTGTPKHNQTLEDARTCSFILLPSFGVIAIFGLILSVVHSYVVWPIAGFLSFGCIAAIVSAVMANDGIKKLFAGDPKAGHDWSPILMLAFSMGFVYAFYPSISPYQLVDDEELGNSIELWTLLISSIPTFVIALLDILDEADVTKCGPGGNHGGSNWSAGDKKYWHCSHLAFLPYYLCIILFFCIIHFPEGRIGKFFKGHSIRTALLAVSFNTVEEFLEAVGFAGGGMQAGGFTGPITQFNVLFMFVILNTAMFTGYLKQTLLKLSTL